MANKSQNWDSNSGHRSPFTCSRFQVLSTCWKYSNMQSTYRPYLTEFAMYQEVCLERQWYIMTGEIHNAEFVGAKQGF